MKRASAAQLLFLLSLTSMQPRARFFVASLAMLNW